MDLLLRLSYTPQGAKLAAAALCLITPPTPVERSASLRAVQWFLDRALGDGIPMTSAGYLKPAVVKAASEVVPAMADWIGENNREANCAPLLEFRQTLQLLGLLRKHKGALALTRGGVAAQRDVDVLWAHLASRLLPKGDGDFETHAGLLHLTFAAASPDADLPYATVGALLTELDWRYDDGRPIHGSELFRLPIRELLMNITDRPVFFKDLHRISPVAAALAREALHR